MRACRQMAPEEFCFKTVFNADYFWLWVIYRNFFLIKFFVLMTMLTKRILIGQSPHPETGGPWYTALNQCQHSWFDSYLCSNDGNNEMQILILVKCQIWITLSWNSPHIYFLTFQFVSITTMTPRWTYASHYHATFPTFIDLFAYTHLTVTFIEITMGRFNNEVYLI